METNKKRGKSGRQTENEKKDGDRPMRWASLN